MAGLLLLGCVVEVFGVLSPNSSSFTPGGAGSRVGGVGIGERVRQAAHAVHVIVVPSSSHIPHASQAAHAPHGVRGLSGSRGAVERVPPLSHHPWLGRPKPWVPPSSQSWRQHGVHLARVHGAWGAKIGRHVKPRGEATPSSSSPPSGLPKPQIEPPRSHMVMRRERGSPHLLLRAPPEGHPHPPHAPSVPPRPSRARAVHEGAPLVWGAGLGYPAPAGWGAKVILKGVGGNQVIHHGSGGGSKL